MTTRESAISFLHTPQARLRYLFGCLLMLAALAMSPLAQAQAQTQAVTPGGASDQPIVHQLLDAMAQNDFQAFTSRGTPEFAALGESQFTPVAGAVAPRLQQGYSVQYLGNLQQQGLDISIWKISFEDQGDDLLATLNVQNGRVGGFFLR